MSKKIHSTYNLLWKRGKNVLTLPVGLATSVRGDYQSDKLICDCGALPEGKSETVVKQKYECTRCGKQYSSIGMIKNRFNYAEGVTYQTEEKHQFLETELDRELEVKNEVPLADVLENHAEILNAMNPLEIYSNDSDKFKQTVVQIWNFLKQKKVALLVECNYRGDNFMGYIIATNTGKLIVSKLNDDKNIKSPYSVAGVPVKFNLLNFVSEKTKKEAQFIDAIKKGKRLPKKVKVEVKPIISEAFFAD